jgi:nucleoside 2-deoxyribosyltransferase
MNSDAPDRLPKVYLAGGFHTGWQDELMDAVPQFAFLDPRVHGLTDRADYTSWDLEAIRCSDLVFAYLEAANPAGYSLALEVGYAKALGKCVVLVDEKSALDGETRRYLGMVQECANIVFESFEEGLSYMKELEGSV